MFGPIAPPLQTPQTTEQIVKSYENGLTLSGDRAVVNLEKNSVEWIGHVQAVYGPTIVTADRISLHFGENDSYGEAVGNVRLTDPIGTINAADLTYNWKKQTGSAHTVTVRVQDLRVVAESIDVQPALWVLRNVGGTGCAMKTPLYYIRTRELRIRPGEGLQAVKPELSILGHKIATLPTQNLSFAGTGGSIDVPYPTYRSDLGFGISWTNDLPITSDTALYTKYATFQHSLPFYNGTLMHSFLKGQSPTPVRTEIGDRFGFGYFDSVQVRNPQTESLFLGTPRLEFGLSSTFGADARDTTTGVDKINKPIEVVGQASGKIGGFFAFGNVRAQEVRVGNGPTIQRAILEQNVRTPDLHISKNLYAFGRVDAAEFTGGNSYSWIRGQGGLAFEPTQNIRLGASYTSVQDHGVPDFAYDAPYRSRELNFRADLDFDTTQLRVLIKYDPSARQLYDREFYFSQVVGCIEPFIVYRERPRKFFIGIKLPINRIFERVSKEIESRPPVRHYLSGGP